MNLKKIQAKLDAIWDRLEERGLLVRRADLVDIMANELESDLTLTTGSGRKWIVTAVMPSPDCEELNQRWISRRLGRKD